MPAPQVLRNGHDSDLTIAHPIPTHASGSEIMDRFSSPSPTPKIYCPPGCEHDTIFSAYLSASLADVALPNSLSSSPAPYTGIVPISAPLTSQYPHPREVNPTVQTALPVSRQLSVNINSTHPSEWGVEQVVAWLRNNGFDDDVRKKFTEHEITGEVLLELDLNMLKELDIMALGKRMRLSIAINGLRYPASVGSSPTSKRYVGQSLLNSRNVGRSNSVPQSLRRPSTMHSPGRVSPSPSVSGTLMTDRFSNFAASDAPEMHDRPPENGKAINQMDSRTAAMKGRNSKPRPLSLAQPSSDDSSTKGFRASERLNSSANMILGIREEPDAFGNNETLSLKTKVTEFRKGFGRSSGSASSDISPSGTGLSGSKAGIITPLTSLHSPNSIDTSEKPSPDVDSSHKSKWSDDSAKKDSAESQRSFFGGSLHKYRKPAPQHSVRSDGPSPSSTGDKLARTLSRLCLPLGSIRRPHTGQGSVTPSGSIEGLGRPLSSLHETGQVLSETSQIIPEYVEKAPILRSDRNVLQQIDNPDLHGWLRKKGGHFNTWKMRYFILKGPHLYYLRSKMETKLKGYINVKRYGIIADENTNRGRYGFRIVHETGGTHYFSSEEQLTVREWTKALIKATIGRDYTCPVISSCNIPTIPLSVAQAMSPSPRPPSPITRDTTQRALRHENPMRLSKRDARVLMGLPSENRAILPEINGDMLGRAGAPSTMAQRVRAASSPVEPSRALSGLPSSLNKTATENAEDIELINWVNDHVPNASVKATNLSTSLATGLVLFRLAESIKGTLNGASEIPDSVFPSSPTDEKLDGHFTLFDFLLDNDVEIGNVTINDVRHGNREKLVQLVNSLKAWEEKT